MTFPAEIILIVLCAILAYMTMIFAYAVHLKRLDVVDIAWGGAFIIAALVSFLLGSMGSLQYVVTAIILLWAVRLSSAISRRFTHSSKEDPRYTDMRKQWKGNVALNAYVRIFLVQGILATIISLSVIFINTSPVVVLGVFSYAGIAIWLVGFLFESVGDAQLKRHLAKPENKGKLMTTGLWRYTRHPNYFGEAAQWWGIFIIALSVPFGWATVVAPLVITGLLLFISGVPLTEKRFNRKPGWAEYKRRTSMFVPLPPRR